jgi:hypothetical protein
VTLFPQEPAVGPGYAMLAAGCGAVPVTDMADSDGKALRFRAVSGA